MELYVNVIVPYEVITWFRHFACHEVGIVGLHKSAKIEIVLALEYCQCMRRSGCCCECVYHNFGCCLKFCRQIYCNLPANILLFLETTKLSATFLQLWPHFRQPCQIPMNVYTCDCRTVCSRPDDVLADVLQELCAESEKLPEVVRSARAARAYRTREADGRRTGGRMTWRIFSHAHARKKEYFYYYSLL